MTSPLGLGFEDFKELSGNHRIYYYEGDNFFDFMFLVDGTMILTTLLKISIDNYERFFSDKMFYGSKRLTFRIPVPTDDPFTIVNEGVKTDAVGVFQDDEMQNEDIQINGVDD